MNRAELIAFIKEPQTLNRHNLSMLKDVASTFPYFQGAHVLISKNLANQKHYELEKYLNQTALSVPNRQVLYQFIHDLKVDAQPIKEELMPTHLANTIVSKVDQVEDAMVIDTPPEKMVDNPPIAIESSPIETVEELPPIILEEMANEGDIQLQEEIQLVVDPEEVNESKNEPISPAAQQLESQEGHTFAEWLALSRNKSIKQEVEPKPDMEVVALRLDKIEDVKEESITPKSEKPETTQSNIPVFESILDKFIQESPRISRPKAEFYNPANMAKHSVVEDEDLVTETLAKLYVQQGHHKKAIRAYEKLCLIYPHKMAYFADLIQKLKQENKD